MKNRIITNSNRAIKKNFSRFLSLAVMSMLGVLVFAGLQATGPDMLHTLDKHLDNNNTYDLKLVSTMGLTDDDLTAIQNLDETRDVEGVNSQDILITINDHDVIINLSSLPEKINTTTIIDGHLPENNNEIVVEENLLTKENLKIGDTIKINNDNLLESEFTIVGTVNTNTYFRNVAVNQTRGNTSIGNGTINYYTYTLSTCFTEEYYETIYITVDGAKETITSQDEYLNLIEKMTSDINNLKSIQEENRYETLYNETKEEIKKQEQEANAELDEAKDTLDSTKSQLNKAQKNLSSAKKTLNQTYSQLQSAKKEIDTNRTALDTALNSYNLTEETLPEAINNLKAQKDSLSKMLANYTEDSSEYQSYMAQITALETQIATLNEMQNNYTQINNAEATYETNLKTYNSAYRQYQSSLKEYNTGLKEYNSGLSEYEKKKNKVEQEITNAYAKLNEIEHPTWYIYNRSDNSTYEEYINDTESITNLAKIFPVVFYSVAILVSLISMNRMVEDDRGEIGTLKSLGFKNTEIMLKYIVFSLLACLIGSLIGVAIGLTFIPTLIFSIYGLLFTIPNFVLTLNFKMTFLSIIIAIVCICGTTIYTAYNVLKGKPAELMRPKAPKTGKRVFLENIKWLWNKISFSNKITIRNISRYKKRVSVTIIGIAGCTALILCGFGIRDAIVDISTVEYSEIFTFDSMVYTNNLTDTSIFDQNEIADYTNIEIKSATLNQSDVNLFIAKDDTEIKNVVNLIDAKTSEIYTLKNNEVAITDKLADVQNIEVGDEITFMDVDNNEYTFTVGAIVKNHIGHYIYMNQETFEKANDEKMVSNVTYLHLNDLTSSEKENLNSRLLESDNILSITDVDELNEKVSNMLQSLNKVVAILIILAALLAFVVLYNLSNINIQERKREIATLKVLGFYNKEVDDYITKETCILTIIGIILGLILGYFLTKGVLSTVEIESCRFIHNIKPLSYIVSSIISITFTIIVNIVTHYSLKKIDMIESLKSVE